MKYYKEDDNRYRVNFMVATEELMDRLTVKEFISYLEENAELEDDEDYEYISGKVVKCRAYDLKEADSKLHKEFLVTEDGRVFYWLSLNQKIELVDREEAKQEVSKEKEMVAGVVNRLIKDFNNYSELVALNYSKMKEGECDDSILQWNRGHLCQIEEYLKEAASSLGVTLYWECKEHTFGYDDWKRQLEYRTVSISYEDLEKLGA